jgi:hypothetical protein
MPLLVYSIGLSKRDWGIVGTCLYQKVVNWNSGLENVSSCGITHHAVIHVCENDMSRDFSQCHLTQSRGDCPQSLSVLSFLVVCLYRGVVR